MFLHDTHKIIRKQGCFQGRNRIERNLKKVPQSYHRTMRKGEGWCLCCVWEAWSVCGLAWTLGPSCEPPGFLSQGEGHGKKVKETLWVRRRGGVNYFPIWGQTLGHIKVTSTCTPLHICLERNFLSLPIESQRARTGISTWSPHFSARDSWQEFSGFLNLVGGEKQTNKKTLYFQSL